VVRAQRLTRAPLHGRTTNGSFPVI